MGSVWSACEGAVGWRREAHMNSNKTEVETRQLIQLKIAELEEKSALLKDYTWLLKVSVSALDLLMILLALATHPPHCCQDALCIMIAQRTRACVVRM